MDRANIVSVSFRVGLVSDRLTIRVGSISGRLLFSSDIFGALDYLDQGLITGTEGFYVASLRFVIGGQNQEVVVLRTEVMATVKRSDSKGMYSWWWNSHISPKNSKWLQENLTDMDIKVKQMIKLIEEDADSFARRAEMYYKKRPELMKLVEEFYRVYRALAERYDHATGVLRQAHMSMAEAFPNQVPMVFADDTPGGSAAEAIFAGESESSILRKDLKQFNDLFGSEEAPNLVKFAEGRAREGLSFNDIDEMKQSLQNDEDSDLMIRVSPQSERASKAEMEILTLKNTLARLEAEKEAGLLEYQQSLERLSALEREVSRAQEDSMGLNERASNAEAEVQTLKDALAKLGAEREANLVQYQQCLEKINDPENSPSQALKEAAELNERASEAEAKAEALNKDLALVEAEKEDSIAQYKQCSETVSDLEEKLSNAEECARQMTERAEKAESELETLKQVVVELTKDKEAAALKYQQCVEMISSLEMKLACAQEETQRLNCEIDDGAAKLKGAEERCSLLDRTNQSLHAELESMVQKMGDQNQELTEKQVDLGRLWTSIQEEHLRFMEAETAFQTLQQLHSQSQEELRAMAAEIQNRAQILQDVETRKHGLEDELQRVKEENKGLNELNLSSAMSIKNLQDEILSLRETIAKLAAEVELRVDQRNALQQEIYCLKEELNDFNKRHGDMTGQLESVCLNPENFASSVKELQEENTKLKDVCVRDGDEKLALLEKLKLLEELNEKNALLENSLSDMIIELEGVHGRVKTLEESCQSLMKEKSILVVEKDTLISQLQIATQNLEKLSDKNNFMENSLSDSNAVLEELRVKLTSLENSCMLLDDEKSVLITQREGLISQLDVTQKRLEHASIVHLSEPRVTALESQIHFLQQESLCWKKEYEEEQNKAMNAQVEIFILQKCAQELEEKNLSLSLKCRKLLEANKVSKKFISELETGNSVNQMVIKSLCDQISMLRLGLYQMLKALEIDAIQGNDDKIKEDQSVLDCILERLQEMQNSLPKYMDENQQLVIENSVLITLLGQLKLEAEDLVTEKDSLHLELRFMSEQFFELHNRTEELRSKETEGGQRELLQTKKIGSVHEQLLLLQREYQSSLKEKKLLTSLESRALLHPKLSSGYIVEVKDSDSGADLHAENCQQISEDQIASVPHGFSDLQGIHLRIKAIEKSVVEMERLAVQENINLNSKLETAMRQIEELRSGSSSLQESIRAKKCVNARQAGRELGHGLHSNVKMQRPTTEISEEDNKILTKDITMLDQISECSSYGLSRRETEEVDNQMLEMWGTIEHDGSSSTDSKMGKAQNMVTAPTDYKQTGTVKGHRSKNPSTESLVKELVVDKEGSRRFTKLNQEGSKRKILERIGSDAQRLANLQITVQDLKRKVDITETGKRGKRIEYGTVKEQLEEAEEAIMKLGDANRKLMTQIEDDSWYPDGKSALDSDESGSVKKQGVPEEAKRGSEKIGRLQLEVQKIQFLLLQLDDGKDSRGRTRVAERKTRVLLRDYLYGGVRNIQKTKKAPFCACLKASTKGD
ncbi:hypothetical protein GQ457_11G002970 [Hibiscus cannabinus]